MANYHINAEAIDIYQEVTDQIISEIENGALPWVREWDGCGMPSNAITGRPYNGINTLILWAKAHKIGYASNRWCTYKQAKDANAQVAKAEKGTRVVFYKTMIKEDKDTGEAVSFPMLRMFTVFNVDQVEGFGDEQKDDRPEVERLATADEFVNGTGAVIVEGEPAYLPSVDKISMPNIDAFKTQAGYYATIFHELGHWTGHETRLARAKLGRFGSESYAADSYTLGRDCGYIRKNLHAFPVVSHVIFYKPTTDGIAIIRVLHKSMDEIRHL